MTLSPDTPQNPHQALAEAALAASEHENDLRALSEAEALRRAQSAPLDPGPPDADAGPPPVGR